MVVMLPRLGESIVEKMLIINDEPKGQRPRKQRRYNPITLMIRSNKDNNDVGCHRGSQPRVTDWERIECIAVWCAEIGRADDAVDIDEDWLRVRR